jgi:hypothetical protein
MKVADRPRAVSRFRQSSELMAAQSASFATGGTREDLLRSSAVEAPHRVQQASLRVPKLIGIRFGFR